MKDFFKRILEGNTVKFTEWSEFPHLSNNGGSYHLYTRVTPLRNQKFKVIEWDSCDFRDNTEVSVITKAELRKTLHNIENHLFGWDAEIEES